MEVVELSTKIPGYRITEALYTGSKTLVYRAVRESDQHPVVIKLLRQEYPPFRELLQFRNQYTIAKNLNLSGVIRFYSLENYRNSYILIMEDFGGISLKEYIATHRLNLEEFLEIALQIVAALDGLYNHRVIHKDIKPANVLINPINQQVKLIDFSIASLLPRETQEIKSSNVFEGTLAYLSPEQTGRMNRGVDYRTDFYSLGVTFYELLTGRLPFETHDPMELVHCHLTKQPPTLEEEIPPVVSDIVMKLMAKNPEDRYQSALGIKHDLEICLNQWQETGHIESFELAKRDICDRFVVSEKLYGRQVEVNTLLAAFDRVSQGNRELILVAGFSGIGKTAVVNEVHKPIVRQRGYFIKGKFDQFQRNIPLAALVQAFRDLMDQLLSESDDRLEEWKAKILAALGENAQAIIEVIPELEQIIGQQPAIPELSGEAAQNRFNRLFQKFIQVFSAPEHPLAIFIDDLQWADSASLKLIQVLMSEIDTGYLLLMGAYRDNEVNPTHPLISTLEKLQKIGTPINTIILAPLSLNDVNHLIADTLNCPSDLAQPLTELIYQKTQGNPFFTNQFLKYLHEEQVISFDFEVGYWQCDMAQIRALTPTDDIVEFMAQQIQRLPQTTQEVLKLAACIGNEFDLHTLAIVAQKTSEEIAAHLWVALQEGLIFPKNEVYKFFHQREVDSDPSKPILENIKEPAFLQPTTAAIYKFLHDRVQQAAYFLIPEVQKTLTHQKIGQLILENTPVAEREEKIFEIVNHLNIGFQGMLPALETEEMIQLNQIAGRKAKSATAYELAVKYFNAALDRLAFDCWTTQYELAITLYLETIEAEYLNANFERSEFLANQALSFANNCLDQVKIKEKQLLLLIAQNRLPEVLQTAREALALLDVNLPEDPGEPGLLVAQIQEGMKSQGIAHIEDLLNLDLMSDSYKLAAMRILMILFAPVLIGYPQLMPVLSFKMVDLCIRYGNSTLATFAYVFYGWLLCGVLGNIEAGYQFGQLGVNLLSKFSVSEINCKTEEVFYGFVKHWKDPLVTTLEPLLKSFQAGIDVGDLEYAGYSATIYCHNLFFAGQQPLEVVTQEQEKYIQMMRKNKQEFLIHYTSIIRQLGLQFQGKSQFTFQLIGESFDEIAMMPVLMETKTVMSIFSVYCCKGILCYFLKDIDQALENAQLADEYVIAVGGMNVFAEHYFYYSLILLAACSTATSENRVNYLKQVNVNQQKMKIWADCAPANYQHKYDLIEAEKLQVLKQPWQAAERYDRAIQGAKQQGYLQEEALANELTAEFYLAQGREKLAQVYLIDAYYAYERWGAKIKVQDLAACYPQLLTPTLQREQFSSPNLTGDATFSPGTPTLETIISHRSSSSSEALDLLDLAAVIKASQALSGEIQLDQLLAKLMQVVIENAGADQGTLLLNSSGKLEIVARCLNSQAFQQLNQPAEISGNEIPLSVINFVKRTQETVLVNDFTSTVSYASDPYFSSHQPQSFLCTPILNQGKLIGILYLENSLTTGTFTSERLEILHLLSSQAAISIENATLYSTLEQKVTERTQELSQTLEDLKATQKKLVESEKMAALGSLVAGVAHEINTPVGNSITLASTLADETQNFAKAIEEGQLKRSVLNHYIEVSVEGTHLILSNLQRAGELIQSFKQVAVDQTNLEKRSFEIKPYIEEVLLSLIPQLKHTHHRLTVVGDETLTINSYPGALAQIITNLVMNSLTHAYQPGEQGHLRVEILQHDHEISIQYSDDGCGIPPENLSKIFDPFFTTARHRGGSGLGLHIVHNLVTQKLQGTIDVSSEAGLGTLLVMRFPLHH